MSMSDHERSLLLMGTLDTSGVGGSPYANLDSVALAFGADVAEEPVVVAVPEPEEETAENGPSEPVKEPEVEPEKPAVRAKRGPAKKVQASAPADE
jgi:hypothetical protein